MSTIIEAIYYGVCVGCGRRFEPGTLITKFADDGWGHATCPKQPLELRREPCPRCFQEPSASGACGCD